MERERCGVEVDVRKVRKSLDVDGCSRLHTHTQNPTRGLDSLGMVNAQTDPGHHPWIAFKYYAKNHLGLDMASAGLRLVSLFKVCCFRALSCASAGLAHFQSVVFVQASSRHPHASHIFQILLLCTPPVLIDRLLATPPKVCRGAIIMR